MKDKIFTILFGIIAVALISCEAATPPDYSNAGTMRLRFVLNSLRCNSQILCIMWL